MLQSGSGCVPAMILAAIFELIKCIGKDGEF